MGRLFIAILLIIAGYVRASCESGCYYGIVIDAVSGEPIAGASAFSPTEERGSYSSGKGLFRICLSAEHTTIIIRSVGHFSDTVALRLKDTVVVRLYPRDISLRAVTVTAGVTAEDVIRSALLRSERERDRTRYVRYSMYSLFTESGPLGSARSTKTRESVADVEIANVSPASTSVVVNASRQIGYVKEDSIPIYDEELDLSSDSLFLRDVHYHYPLAIAALPYYDYQFRSRNDDPCQTVISFRPRSRFAPGFEGTVTLCETDSMIHYTSMRLINPKDLAYVDSFSFVRWYDPNNKRLWFPVRDSLSAIIRAEIVTGLATIRRRRHVVRTMMDVEFDMPPATPRIAQETPLGSSVRRVYFSGDTSIASRLLAERSEVPDSVVRVNRGDQRGRRSSIPDSLIFTKNGFALTTIGTAPLRILPVLFRSQQREFGWGGTITVDGTMFEIGGTYGVARDDETLYGAHGWLHMAAHEKFAVSLRGSFLSGPRSVYCSRADESNVVYQFLAPFNPSYFQYYRNERTSLGLELNLDRSTTTLDAYVDKASTMTTNATAFQPNTHSQLNATYLVQELSSEFHWSNFSVGVSVQRGNRIDSTISFWSSSADIHLDVTMIGTDLGSIGLIADLHGSTSSQHTPVQYAAMELPRFQFMGRDIHLASLSPNDLSARDAVHMRAEIALEDLPWRIFGLPSFNGISPHFGLVGQIAFLNNAYSLTSASTPTLYTFYEAGIQLRSIPLLITSMAVGTCSFTWAINPQAPYQEGFRMNVGIATPLTGVD